MTSYEITERCWALVARGTKPTRPEVRELTRAFYALPGNGTGGRYLHCVLDDHNYERCHIRSARAEAERDGRALEVALCDVLLMLSNSQRRRGV